MAAPFTATEAMLSAAREWHEREATEVNAPPLLDHLVALFGITIEQALAVSTHPLAGGKPQPVDCEPGNPAEWDVGSWDMTTWGA